MAVSRPFMLLALFLATGAVAAEKKAPPPDPDLLEFIGTYRTAGGKDIDPVLLEGDRKVVKPGTGGAASGAESRKKLVRKSPLKERETDND